MNDPLLDLPPVDIAPLPPVKKVLNLHEEHAREKQNLPADWRVFRWSCYPQVCGEPTLYYEIEGAVCHARYVKGRRLGRTNWTKLDKTTRRTVVLLVAEHEQWCREWEQRTGKCRECTGAGEVFARWHHETGNTYKPCPRCGGTGDRPELATN